MLSPGAVSLKESVAIRSRCTRRRVAFFHARAYAISRGPQRRV